MSHSPLSSSPAAPARNVALDHLRAFITLLVIAHHAVLAYHPYAPAPGKFNGDDLVWGAFPVVDSARGPGFDLFTLWNDSFFMMLMFLLSGLFVGPSLQRKGAGQFLRERFIRLGIPFLLGAFVLAPFAYYPAYLERAAATPGVGFWKAWFSLGCWPAGPMWFLWVLLAYGVLAALIHRLIPRWSERAAKFNAWGRERPGQLFLVLAIVATVSYLPATFSGNSSSWAKWGPFFIETSRIGLYAVYFFFGAALGGGGVEIGLVSPQGKLARHWMGWPGLGVAAFVAFVGSLVMTLTAMAKGGPPPSLVPVTITGITSGAASSFALLAIFARWPGSRSIVWASLARNAFAMYVLHYAIVTWLQFSLLSVTLPGLVKGLVVTVAAWILSWGGAVALRKIPLVARIC